MNQHLFPTSTRYAASRGLLAALVLTAVAGLGGCYERVVSSKGVGAQQTQSGYRSDTMLDRAYDDLTGSSEPKSAPRPKVGALRAR